MRAECFRALLPRCARVALGVYLLPLLCVVASPLAEQPGSNAPVTAQPMLIVSVRYGTGGEPGQAGVGSRQYQTADRREVQQLTMLAGGTARLTRSSQQAYPVIALLPAVGAGYGLVGGLDEQPLRTGFTVTPTVQGNEVILDIAVQVAHRSQSDGGAVDSTQLQTRVKGALGSWISLVGEGLSAPAKAGTKSYSTARKKDVSDEDIWVRVDRVD